MTTYVIKYQINRDIFLILLNYINKYNEANIKRSVDSKKKTNIIYDENITNQDKNSM